MGELGHTPEVTVETTHRHPDPANGPWQLTLLWSSAGERVECVGMRLVRTGEAAGGEPLGESLLRGLNISARIARDRAALAGRYAAPARPPRGMRAATFTRLQRVAEVYRTAQASGKAPTKAVAEELGVAYGTASATVSKARSIGLLPPTSAGVALGEVSGT